MSIDCLNPEGLETPQTYSHVVVARGTRWVFVAGQVAEDEQGHGQADPGCVMLSA